MKRLLLPLLAALALPTAVNAETIWLLLSRQKAGFEKIDNERYGTMRRDERLLVGKWWQ